MKKDYLLVSFGSRGEVEVERRCIDKKDILNEYENFKKECIEEGCEYIIEEFGMCKEVGDGIILLGMSDEGSEMWIEVNDSNRRDIEDIEDLKKDIYEYVDEIEEKYKIEYFLMPL